MIIPKILLKSTHKKNVFTEVTDTSDRHTGNKDMGYNCALPLKFSWVKLFLCVLISLFYLTYSMVVIIKSEIVMQKNFSLKSEGCDYL